MARPFRGFLNIVGINSKAWQTLVYLSGVPSVEYLCIEIVRPRSKRVNRMFIHPGLTFEKQPPQMRGLATGYEPNWQQWTWHTSLESESRATSLQTAAGTMTNSVHLGLGCRTIWTLIQVASTWSILRRIPNSQTIPRESHHCYHMLPWKRQSSLWCLSRRSIKFLIRRSKYTPNPDPDTFFCGLVKSG